MSRQELLRTGAEMSEVRSEEPQKAVLDIQRRGKRQPWQFFLSDRNLFIGITRDVCKLA